MAEEKQKKQKSISPIGSALLGNSIDMGFGAIGSGIQTLFGIASSKYNADLEYQYNKKLADDAYQRQLDFWNLQNAYNTPAAQMSRLRQAGLNPALLNGGVQGNTAGNLSSVPTASVSAGGSMPSSPAANLGAMAETMSKLASAGMINEQTKYWLEQAIGAGIENDVKRILRGQGWSDAAIKEMDRAALWKAAHPDEDLPDNPYFDEWSLPDGGINPYQTAEDEARQRIANMANQIKNDDARLALEQADFDLEKTFKTIRNEYAEKKNEQELNKLLGEVAVLWSDKCLKDSEQALKNAQTDSELNRDARATQLHNCELLLKQLEAAKVYSETELNKIEDYKERLKVEGPGWDLKEINDFIGVVITEVIPDYLPF